MIFTPLIVLVVYFFIIWFFNVTPPSFYTSLYPFLNSFNSLILSICMMDLFRVFLLFYCHHQHGTFHPLITQYCVISFWILLIVFQVRNSLDLSRKIYYLDLIHHNCLIFCNLWVFSN